MNIHIPISMINSIHAHRFIYTLHNSPYIVLNQAKKVVFSFLFFFSKYKSQTLTPRNLIESSRLGPRKSVF